MSRNVPLVFQAFHWSHGVYLAATMGSEATAAAEGQAAVRRDPMAMLPFCGYNMADYWNHWLNVGRFLANPPRIFRVNWFRRDDRGNYVWPGFGENMRVLKWILDRVHGRRHGVESPIGIMPGYRDIQWEGLEFDRDTFYALMSVERDEGSKEVREQEDLFDLFFDRLPKEFTHHRELFKSRVWRSPKMWAMAKERV